MAKTVVRDASLFLGAAKLASLVNTIPFEEQADEVESTNFGSQGWREIEQGIKRAGLSAEVMLQDVAEPLTYLRGLVSAGTLVPFSATKSNPPVQGDRAWFQKVTALYITQMFTLGQLWRGSMRFGDKAPAVYGRVLEYNPNRTATGNSAVFDLGVAVGATERLWVATHVVNVTGGSPTLDLLIQSDDAGGFASPLTRVTVPQFGAVGSDIQSVDGPITDTFWRVAATVGGTTPAFDYLVVFGIAPKV